MVNSILTVWNSECRITSFGLIERCEIHHELKQQLETPKLVPASERGGLYEGSFVRSPFESTKV